MTLQIGEQLRSFRRWFDPRVQKLALDYPVALLPRAWGGGGHPILGPIVERGRSNYHQTLHELAAYIPCLADFGVGSPAPGGDEPFWNNGFLPGFDVFALYAFLAHFRPRRYVEIGSGNSTRLAHRARRDHGLPTEITSIDPMPRASIDRLADRIIRKPLELVDQEIFAGLDETDILFLDSSHVLLPNSDVLVFFLEIMPRLKPGVLIHIHDVYLPYDYPDFMCRHGYNEQYLLAVSLLANPERFEIVLPNFFASQDPELAANLGALWNDDKMANVERHGGSFWFRLRA